jgi:hypothetical protein
VSGLVGWIRGTIRIDSSAPDYELSLKEYQEYLKTHTRSNMSELYKFYKDLLYKALGDKCYDCGTTDRRVFELHHKNPNIKERKMYNYGALRHMLHYELGNILLVCANCHKIRTDEHKYIGILKLNAGRKKKDRPELEKLLKEGKTSYKDLAKQFNLSTMQIGLIAREKYGIYKIKRKNKSDNNDTTNLA